MQKKTIALPFLNYNIFDLKSFFTYISFSLDSTEPASWAYAH